MARPFGVPLVVAPSWLLAAVAVTYAVEPWVRGRLPGLGSAGWAVAAGVAVVLYASVLAHELSHCFVARRRGLGVRRVTLHLIGGFTELEGQPSTPGQATTVAVSGPATNVVLAAAGWALSLATPEGAVVHVLAVAAVAVNVAVGGFNLLPALPLDGGRLLEAAIWKASGRRATGTLVAAAAGRALASIILLGSFIWASSRPHDAPLLTAVAGMVLAAHVWLGAHGARVGSRTIALRPGVGARTLARRAIPVSKDLPVSEAVRRADEAGARALVVVDARDQPSALVEEAAVAALAPARRPWTSVGTLAHALEPDLVLADHLAGAELLSALARRPAPEYLVVDDEQRVVGVLSHSDVEAALTADG